ncbi:uncharacterized protein A4U43_UnF11710 [Asparagus officinalis]|uniref:Homeobox domain-containing protein n=1 Tax=Asparagus officinalis TaxID=4686 RepID=A0A1R3L583_ASPOF|nr:BEL1-like homeodomain protein 9 [Asparagus officinalis]XP_020250872.1 BEL1-like homeodomain protein 9 [Asparagus officinalis]XP_020250873.1 BEL1-like homeodomain protein 9 [Asparagus officinalis]ONK54770.1 uncharacterized protein A4U43_UnF11710 [Asparagus officinalis]
MSSSQRAAAAAASSCFSHLNVEDNKVAANETQGLSLSLASKPLVELHMPSSQGQISPPAAKLLMMDPRRSVGPLGPFTGYATILKSSKFLSPAQQLLDEFCSAVTGAKATKQEQYGHDHRNRNMSFVGVGGSGSGSHCDDGSNYRVKGGNSVASSSSFHNSMEVGSASEGGAGVGSGSSCSIEQPEIQQRKVKLLYLQEEVCRRYKQYHQQMQMVVSSFESVAGLSAATPYTSLALKAISKQFRSIKHAISNQLRHMSRILGEDFISSPSSSSRGETTMTPQLKYLDQSLRRQKASENASLSFLDNNQPVWRPQRGLPERAVSVLRAWLFEHFLHPYPTDTDKHMLATQTGLTRNQVSNWFINARVRLWKPMVEEIHMLESKGMAEMDLNSSNKNDRKSIMDNIRGQPLSDQGSESQSNKKFDCSSMDPIAHDSSSISNMEQWHREKRSRMEECTVAGGIDGGLMSFGYQGGMMDVGGLGSVSLTLGLQHNEDAQQQEQQMRHFGSHMLHDFVG